MATKVRNITDHPNLQSQIIDIYSGSLLPGEEGHISDDKLNDEKIFKLVEDHKIAIGGLYPLFYTEWLNSHELQYDEIVRRYSEVRVKNQSPIIQQSTTSPQELLPPRPTEEIMEAFDDYRSKHKKKKE